MRLAAILSTILMIAAPALAQPASEQYSGRTIAAVRLSIDGQATSDPELVDLLETRAGAPLLMADVRESIAHLFSLGRFQDIQVHAVGVAAAGVELRYDLVPVRAIARVDFTGNLGVSEGVLRRAVEERFGRRPQAGRAAEIVRVLQRLYEDRGYFKPTITALPMADGAAVRSLLRFDIDAGPQARIGDIEIAGDPRATRVQLLSRLELSPGLAYERVELDARLSAYVARLKAQGHLQAGASHRARISDDGQRADVTVDLQPGPVVSVTFAGDPLPRDQRDALVPLRREGSLDEDLIEDSVTRIEQYLREQGYWKARATVERQESADGAALTIVFAVSQGPLYRVAPEGVEIAGNRSIPAAEVRPLVVLAPGQPYIASRLDATAGALLRLYRSRGFAWAEVKTAELAAEVLVRPVITISEGPRALIGQIRITGVQALAEAEVLRVVRLQPGSSYYEPLIRADRDAIELEYRDRGFASVQVAVAPEVSEDRARVDLTVSVVEGPQTIVDHIIIVGNTRTSEDVIRREIALTSGEPLGLRDVLESRRRLSQLGLFRRIDIRELEHGAPTRRDLLVTVEEAPATTVGYGGGVELSRRLRATGPGGEAEERIELAPRGFFDIGRRNLWGKNRSVNLFTRVSIRPTDAADDLVDPGGAVGFNEYRVVGTYREPRAFDWNADFSLTGAIEQGDRTSFNFVRRGITADLVRRLTPSTRTSIRYSFGTTRTFDERLSEEDQAVIDRRFPRVRLSAVSGTIIFDRRDDVADPTSGVFLSAETSMASRATGGQVGFLKSYLQGSWFTPVPGARRIILATRASIGLADGFPREVPATDAEGRPIAGTPEIVEDLPASERFFAGGDTTIRGFALDTVGVEKTISPRGFPRGGNGVMILNAELRLPVWRDLGAAVFVDGGNVWERVTDVEIGQVRGSAGFGLRYRSPIGPVRVDLGFKMDRREFGGRVEPRRVLHLSIGQAF